VAGQTKKWPFRTAAGPQGELLVQVEHKDDTVELTAEQVAGYMLERMRDTASGACNGRLGGRSWPPPPGRLTQSGWGARARQPTWGPR
jgi:hypothetical protein